MEKGEIDKLYDYMTYDLRIPNEIELEDMADSFKEMVTEEQYLQLEPHLNMLISIAEKQGFKRVINLLTDTLDDSYPVGAI